RASGTRPISRRLRSVLLSAAVCLLWPSDPDLSLAAQPDRWGKAFGGRDQTVGDALAAGVLEVRIIVRGDSGFCRQRLLRGCERHDVGYVIGVARNARVHKAVVAWEDELKAAFAETGIKQRCIERVSRREAANTIAPRKRNWTSSVPAPVAIPFSPTRCACCGPPSRIR